MATVFGTNLSRRELEQRVGHLSQIASVRLMQMQQGLETGVRIADVRSGSGLRFQISLDRGMDISVAEYKGLSLAWRSPQGDVHPSHFDPKGMGWLKSFSGGLMTGCGLTTAGAPSTDAGEELGIHGRLSNLQASNIKTETKWDGDSCVFKVSGVIQENVMFKENLALYRTIEVELGKSIITLSDRVVNEGFRRSPLMMLYHINLGWPLLDEGAAVHLNARSMKPRDAEAQKGIDTATKIPAPISAYKEQVFYHDLVADKNGFASAMLANPKLGLGLFAQYRQKELPRFIEWKMVAEGEYVLGFEPANCLVEGRAKERERGTLEFIEPGETKEFVVHIGVLDGTSAIDQFKNENNLS
jgi:hypothetical protein